MFSYKLKQVDKHVRLEIWCLKKMRNQKCWATVHQVVVQQKHLNLTPPTHTNSLWKEFYKVVGYYGYLPDFGDICWVPWPTKRSVPPGHLWRSTESRQLLFLEYSVSNGAYKCMAVKSLWYYFNSIKFRVSKNLQYQNILSSLQVNKFAVRRFRLTL